MALKLALPSLDKRNVALAKARLRAWWEGADFDEAGALAAIEAAANDAGQDGNVDAELFAAEAEPEDPRLDALQRIWGQGRVGPGDDAAEAGLATKLNLTATATLGLFGPGLGAPVTAIAQTHLGEIRVFEWREETLPALRRAVTRARLDARVTVSAADLETFSSPAEAFDGLVSLDDFSFADNAGRLAQQLVRGLKPKAMAVIEMYCGVPGSDIAAGFAAAFREPQIRPADKAAAILEEAGLRVDANDDITDAHIEAVKVGFRRLGEALKTGGQLSPIAGRELAWETEAWRVRVRLLAARRLERRCFVVTKR